MTLDIGPAEEKEGLDKDDEAPEKGDDGLAEDKPAEEEEPPRGEAEEILPGKEEAEEPEGIEQSVGS